MWQPFNSQAGIHRPLLEVTQFLHGFGYGRPGSDFSRWQGASAAADGLPEVPGPTLQSAVDEPRPKIRNVTLADFSSGISGLLPVIGTEPTRRRRGLELLAYATDQGRGNEIWTAMFRAHFGQARKLWTVDDEGITKTGRSALAG
jgi:hypothetical protein